jgi:hypothetical protein
MPTKIEAQIPRGGTPKFQYLYSHAIGLTERAGVFPVLMT